MRCTNATSQDLTAALAEVNKRYDGNVSFNREPEPRGNALIFTLRVNNSKGPGHRRGFGTAGEKGRFLTSACWHVHGHFFEALWQRCPDATIWAGALKMESNADNWQDRNIGSVMYPLYFSEACDCHEEGRE